VARRKQAHKAKSNRPARDGSRALEQALSLYGAGRAGEAEARCREVLERDPRHARALHLAGVLAHERGDGAGAADLLERAVRAAPREGTYRLHLGEAYRALGRHEAAVECYRRALALDSRLADACYGLGNALFELGRLEEAATAYRRGVALAPADAELHNNLGNTLAALGRPGEALEHYRRAVAVAPAYADAHANLGWALGELGRLAEAAQSYRRAAELRPGPAQAHFQLGNALRNLERYEEAIACYEAALERDPGYALALNNLGYCLDQLGRPAEAMAHFERALALEPGLAEIHANMGMCLQNQGRFDEAIGAYRRAIELKHDFGDAYFNLASNKRYRASEDDIAAMRELLARPDVSADARIGVHFALAKVHEDRDDVDQAFDCYRAGNALKAERMPFDPAQFRDYVDRVIETFSAAFFRERQGFGAVSDVPVFIVGMPRSGSSLVEQIVSSHPQVYGAGERQDMRITVGDLPAILNAGEPFPECTARLGAATARRLGQDYLASLRRDAPESPRITDKMLGNYLRFGLIALILPGARVVHCRRDPVDTCLSCYFQNFAHGLRFTYDLRHLGAVYRGYERLMAHWREVLPLPILDVQYEELVADLEGKSRELVAFLGLDWDERCLAFHEQQREVRTASFWQVRQPLYRSSAGRWRRYQKHLGPLLEALGYG